MTVWRDSKLRRFIWLLHSKIEKRLKYPSILSLYWWEISFMPSLSDSSINKIRKKWHFSVKIFTGEWKYLLSPEVAGTLKFPVWHSRVDCERLTENTDGGCDSTVSARDLLIWCGQNKHILKVEPVKNKLKSSEVNKLS